MFVPSAEGSPEKRRACHAHHWNLLSFWSNTVYCLRVTLHPSAYSARSASPQPYSVPASNTIHKHFTNHRVAGSPTQFSSKLTSNPVPSTQKAECPTSRVTAISVHPSPSCPFPQLTGQEPNQTRRPCPISVLPPRGDTRPHRVQKAGVSHQITQPRQTRELATLWSQLQTWWQQLT